MPRGRQATEGDRLYTAVRALEPGESDIVQARIRAPINSQTGDKLQSYTLELELRNGNIWYSDPASGVGIAPLRQPMIVEDPTSSELGIWSRQRNNLTDGFRDIAAAAVSQVPDGVVLDGELVVSTNGRLDFDALQKRLVTTSPARARQLIAAIPASYVAFDLLAYAGVDLRTQRWATRRSRLEQLASGWSPPLQLTPVTYDLAEAREWFDVLPAAMGVEGLVLKPTARYTGGRRSSWAKINSLGVGSARPRRRGALCLVRWLVSGGLPCATGVADVRWWRDGGSAGGALQAGQWRHPLRMVRIRAEMQPEDVATLPDPAVDA